MKTRITNSSLILILAACGVIFFAGCANMETGNTTSLLSQAGFRTRTPQSAKQKELYAEPPSNKVERATVKGKDFCVFKDEKAMFFQELVEPPRVHNVVAHSVDLLM